MARMRFLLGSFAVFVMASPWTSCTIGNEPLGWMPPDGAFADTDGGGNVGDAGRGGDAGGIGDAGRDDAGCASDSDCTNGTRCCVQDGICNPVVAENGDCDCDHPCPSDQACSPGVCGALPQVCRTGCYPGSSNPAPYGTAPAACAPQEIDDAGYPTYCEALPASESTAQNQGGACAIGDNCSVTAQNCPDLPLDRSDPDAGDLVPYNCVPLSPTVNGCVPAGTIPIGGTGCTQTCGSEAGNCVKGGWCQQPVDDDGNPVGPTICEEPCGSPTTMGGAMCPGYPGNPEIICDPVFGLGMVYFNEGVCCSEGSCTQNGDCCSGSCEGGECY